MLCHLVAGVICMFQLAGSTQHPLVSGIFKFNSCEIFVRDFNDTSLMKEPRFHDLSPASAVSESHLGYFHVHSQLSRDGCFRSLDEGIHEMKKCTSPGT